MFSGFPGPDTLQTNPQCFGGFMDICRNTSINFALLSKSPGNQELKNLYQMGICMSGKEGGLPKHLSVAVKPSP
jgi:hypothetical protein